MLIYLQKTWTESLQTSSDLPDLLLFRLFPGTELNLPPSPPLRSVRRLDQEHPEDLHDLLGVLGLRDARRVRDDRRRQVSEVPAAPEVSWGVKWIEVT